jgi:eukaryotic-like serine/threonine-protein kinase
MINPPKKGDRLGHYRVDRLISRGGMASIYRGTDLETACPVAIKVPHPEIESDVVFFDRFHREADIGRKLEHPGVAKVLPDPDAGRVCMIMEWVEGIPLRKILDAQGKIPQERAVRIALRICGVLGYIHEQGVVHRDLKPDNILMDANDNIKLIDFGIASEAGSRRLTFGKLTRSMGTPDYVSPEQVKGKRGDERSDVYSLGVMLYEMVSGEVPFRSPNPLVAMNQRLLKKAALPLEIEPAVTPQLREIIHRALERDPGNRYATAREFAWDLEHPEQVCVADDAERGDSGPHPSSKPRLGWSYAALMLIPLIIFVLLLLVARQQ